jgi:catechol 2,3-dioxygenase-like lactoylglutathione lyase family enzyme
MIRPIDVAHVNFNVTDMARSEKFYQEILGLHVSGRHGDSIVFMNLGQYRDGDNLMFHDIALYQVPLGVTEDYRKRAGVNHTAFRLATPEDVDRAYEFLKSKGVKVLKAPITHSEDMDHCLYFEDPDGNVLEVVASTLAGYPQEYLRKAAK